MSSRYISPGYGVRIKGDSIVSDLPFFGVSHRADFDNESPLRIRTRTLAAYREFRDARVRFFANISHELRTPVTIIQSAGNSIESQTDNQQIRDEVSQLQEASHRLLHLIDRVVDITNISIRPVDEAQWCHDDTMTMGI